MIILYMIFRSLFSDSSQGQCTLQMAFLTSESWAQLCYSGLASFEPEFCYNVYGYTQVTHAAVHSLFCCSWAIVHCIRIMQIISGLNVGRKKCSNRFEFLVNAVFLFVV